MSNLIVMLRHGDGNAENIREAPGRKLYNGEVVVHPVTGKVVICTDHDVTADTKEYGAAAQTGAIVVEADNPGYVAGGATVLAERGGTVFLDLMDPANPFNADTNPYNAVVWAKTATSVILGVVEQFTVTESCAKFRFRFTAQETPGFGAGQ